jgi:hypothetical protein
MITVLKYKVSWKQGALHPQSPKDNMSRINTISEFLLHAGTDYRIFDMGRAIRPLSSQLFLDLELGSKAAPYPRQQHAWFGIVFFNKGLSQEHFIWFVKLPLDEQSKIVSAARNQFLQIVAEALGLELEKKTGHNKAELPENPFTFIPNQQQLANFNSISRRSLGLPPSQYFSYAKQYMQAPEQLDWKKITVQGLADLGAAVNDEPIQTLLFQQFPHLTYEVKLALCETLENHPINNQTATFLVDEWRRQKSDQRYLLATTRALSQSISSDLVMSFLREVLNQKEFIDNDLLVLIAARHWQALEDKALMSLFMQHLSNADAALFVGLFRDLVQIPSCRQLMLNVLRWPEKDPALLRAIEILFESQTI